VSSSDTIAIGAAIIALLSVVISGGAFVVSWLAYQRDVGKLAFNYSNLVLNENFDDLSLVLEITNKGRRPVTVKAIRFYKIGKYLRFFERKELTNTVFLKTKEFLPGPIPQEIRRIPVKLEEGQTYSEDIHGLDEKTVLAVNETSGKNYWLRMDKVIKELKKQPDYHVFPKV
jgi:hypothetical protein